MTRAFVWGLVFALSGRIAKADKPSATADLPPAATRVVSFEGDILPLLKKHCLECHGGTKRKGGLRLDRKADAFAGGDSGSVIEVGKSAESRLIELTAGLDPDQVMPPEGDRLSSAEVGLLRAWIDQGASWPEADVKSSVAKSDHWAFRPIARTNPPKVIDAGRVRNPIDAFVLRKLEQVGATPSEEADRPTLLRRLSLDLIGLPPTPAEVDDFLADDRPNAYERQVERLLKSPHYGERWGRHWLDLARYADSDGYEKDSPRPYAWRYRDWVIDAVNDDMPYDEFTLRQLAGDLLPNADLQSLAATGFHRNTLTNREGGVDQEEYRVAAVVDRVNTTGSVWLGLTIGCAQCHTHKYDPISQREYYSLFAFFNTSKEVDLSAPLPSDSLAYQAAKADHDAEARRLREAFEKDDASERPKRQTAWEQSLSTPEALAKIPDEAVGILAIPEKSRDETRREELAEFHRAIDPTSRKLSEAIRKHARQAPDEVVAVLPVLQENPSPPKSHIHIRGDFLRKGAEVRPATLEVLNELKPTGKTPTRADLARWLTDKNNPLTARVAVNRVWRNLFGKGLVRTAEDFGTRGDPPTHPELLDYLAAEFMNRGWSQKELIRLIAGSATYRQSSATRADVVDRDPNNDWLARQGRFRLEAEALRDAALAVSGLLNRKVKGPSIRPPLPAGVAALGYANSVKWKDSEGADKYRRGLYIFYQRTVPYPMLSAFDAPDSNVSCLKRERSNTPVQALTMMNDSVFVDSAKALGRRIISAGIDAPDAKSRFAFRAVLGRDPNARESERLIRLVDELRGRYYQSLDDARKLVGEPSPNREQLPEAAAWIVASRVLLNLDEFVTRE